jgi:hypothetical protein
VQPRMCLAGVKYCSAHAHPQGLRAGLVTKRCVDTVIASKQLKVCDNVCNTSHVCLPPLQSLQ